MVDRSAGNKAKRQVRGDALVMFAIENYLRLTKMFVSCDVEFNKLKQNSNNWIKERLPYLLNYCK